jgi:hypothetical protein
MGNVLEHENNQTCIGVKQNWIQNSSKTTISIFVPGRTLSKGFAESA